MKTATKSLNEITQEATRLLYKELGVVNTIRFLNQITTGYGNYTKEREQLFANMPLDEIISEIKTNEKEIATIKSR